MGLKRMKSKKNTDIWSTPWIVEQKPLRVEIGDLSLTINHQNHEWQLVYFWTKKENQGEFSCHYIDEFPETPTSLSGIHNGLARIAMETMTDELTFNPQLADRPVVVRPYSPLLIPANNKITLYISAPLWLCINFSKKVKRELPVQQLSDTWMGLITGKGELCYGSYTHARLDQDMLLRLPYRALTPVTMRNKSNADFTLERLSIPAPYLSLYAGDGQLVTEPLSIVMDSEKHQGVVEIGKVSGKKAITPPRKKADKGILVNTWENLFA